MEIYMPPPPLKNSAGGILYSDVSVREWVSEWVCPENLVTPYLKNQWKEFHPILITDVFEFIDLLIRFWGQRSQSQQTVTQKVWEHHMSQTSEYLISPNLGTDVFGFRDVLISFWCEKVKGQGHIRQWSEKLGECNICVTIGGYFITIKLHMYLGLGHTD